MTDVDGPATPAAPGPAGAGSSEPAEPAGAGTPEPAAGPVVLDASAALAWLRAEPGADVVETRLRAAALSPVISAVNLSEIYQKLAQRGVDAARTLGQLRTLGIRTEPVDTDDAIAAAKLWPATRAAGLSLGDRCCLALAARLGGPALTADTAWAALDLGVTVVPIR